MKRLRSIPKIVAISVVLVVVFNPTLAIAVWKVLHGHGAAVYTNVYGLTIQYTSVLIFVMVLIATIVVAFVARMIYLWRTGHDGRAKLRKIESPARSVSSGRSE